MQQCTNCKCQVGSGISICPYCGTQLPLEEYAQPGRTVSYGTEREPAQRSGTYRITQFVKSPESGYPNTTYQMIEPPVGVEPVMYYYADYRRRWTSTEMILLVLLVGMIVASLFEFMAVLLLLLQ